MLKTYACTTSIFVIMALGIAMDESNTSVLKQPSLFIVTLAAASQFYCFLDDLFNRGRQEG